MINIQTDDPIDAEITDQVIVQTAETALRHQNQEPQDLDLSIVLTSDARLKKLNNQFLGIDAPTDVLSFPSDEIDPDTQHRYLGDIIISFPQARKQAEARQGTPLSEVQLLIVHGVLHLLGYDHADEEEKATMWKEQTNILLQLGVSA